MLSLLILVSCSTPGKKNLEFAHDNGWQAWMVPGGGFEHQVYVKTSGKPARTWHVYIEGDGRPWLAHRYVSSDPTVETPLLMRLASRDPSPLIYLARPCYQRVQMPPECQSKWWTSHRYSQAVVDSMVSALESVAQKMKVQSFTLIGHSGGATIASLMAPRLKGVRVLVTLAGNLDTAQWVRHHGYSSLSGSLNPIQRPPLPAELEQYHFSGGRDQNIPPGVIRAYAQKQPRARLESCADCSHVSGWEKEWTKIMDRLRGVW